MIFIIAEIISVGVIIICVVKISSKRKYWSYWEQFSRSKEVLPIPSPLKFNPEGKEQAKKLLKSAGYATLVLVVLITIHVLVTTYL